jgi:beta-galactosidase
MKLTNYQIKDVLGIWCEEIDALFPEERNSIEWQGKSYPVFGLCEIIHLKGAVALGHYGSDFYARTPALTVNQHGNGKAYFIAARTGADFLADFYRKITGEAGIHPALDAPLPDGVAAQVRSDGQKDYIFLMNFTNKGKKVESRKTGGFTLAPFEVRILSED